MATRRKVLTQPKNANRQWIIKKEQQKNGEASHSAHQKETEQREKKQNTENHTEILNMTHINTETNPISDRKNRNQIHKM